MARKIFVILAVTAVLWSAGGCGGPRVAGTHFYFVQITDPHFGLSDTPERVQRCVEEIKSLPMPMECIVVTGDITMDAILDPNVTGLAKEMIGEAGLPVHWLPGNHDINPKNLPATIAAYTENFGPLCSRAEYKGVVFLMVYTEPLRGEFVVDGFDVYEWTQRELKAAGRKPVIIFHHSPSIDDFYKGKFHDSWKAEGRARWHRLIESHKNIKAVIAGHFHRDEFHWIGEVPQFVCPPAASLFGMSVVSYRIYEYTDGKVGYRTEYPRKK